MENAIIIEKTREALKKCGVKGSVRGFYIAVDRIKIIIDNEYFGIFDCKRNTFVD
jgi:hypothetical protein